MTRDDDRPSRVRRAVWATVLLCVLAAAAGFAALRAVAAGGPPTPVISSVGLPTNPTDQTSARFMFTDAQSVTFECARGGASYSPCGANFFGSKSYPGPLSAGSHTFRVRAVKGGRTSSAAVYTWAILASPHVVSISRRGPSPTKAGSVQWQVTFSESVIGLETGNFSLVESGLSGSPAITRLSGSDSVYSVTVSTGSGTPSGSGTMQLRLSSVGAVKDLAGNVLTGLPFDGETYAIDKTAVTPTFTRVPPDPSSSAVSTFAWNETPEPNLDRYQCSREHGPWQACSSPLTFSVAAAHVGQHRFEVRAIDTAGNVSSPATYGWKLSRANGAPMSGAPTDETPTDETPTDEAPFEVTGSVAGLAPGVTKVIVITLKNPNPVPIYVTSLTVGISADSKPSGCPSAVNIVLYQATGITSGSPVTVPANGSVTVNTYPRAPKIGLRGLLTNQDKCKRATFTLTYNGSAHS